MIREGTIEDLNFIIDFQVRMALETEDIKLDETVLKKGIQALFDYPERGQYYVAEVSGKVVGSILTTYEWSDWRNGNIIWLQSVYILPEYRGQKLFSEMYNYIKAKCEKDNTIQGIRLYVEKANTHAQKVYKAMGMNEDHYDMYEWMKTF